LIVAPLNPFAENSSNAASRICARRSNSSTIAPLLDQTFNDHMLHLIERLIKYRERRVVRWLGGARSCLHAGG
jgi:hypothetical protein